MTEREIPDAAGFHFGGKTDDLSTESAPLVLSEPEKRPTEVLATTSGVGFSSRREARAAGQFSVDAAAVAPAYAGVASLFPLLEEVVDVAVSPVSPDSPASPNLSDDLATQAMPIAEVEAELSTPVAPYVVPQDTPVAFVPVSIVPVSTVPPVAEPRPQTPSWHIAEVFGLASTDHEADTVAPSRRGARNAARAQPTARRKAPSRGRRGSLSRADRRAWARGEDRKPSGRSAADRTATSRTATSRTATSRTAVERKSIRQRVFGLGVMVLVGGLFAVLALPAYADNDASTLAAAAAVRTQKLAVANVAASAISTGTRDVYTATSAADLKKLYSDALRESNLSAYLQSGAKAQGDDYPWFAELSRNQGGGLSPLNYYYRECVDFVAWRLNRDQGSTHAPFKWNWSTLTPSGGNASQWKSAWLSHGWATGATPVVGSVAWFPTNHVAYVSGILTDGQVLLEEYNGNGDHLYGTRVINPGDAYYLYAPPS